MFYSLILKLYSLLVEWSEVWAIAIPLTILLLRKDNFNELRFVIYYLVVTFTINIAAELIWLYNNDTSIIKPHWFPDFLKRNNFLYNLRSISNVLFFTLFFQSQSSQFFLKVKLVLALFFSATVLIFSVSSFWVISSHLFALEGIVLLVYCVSFFIQRMRSEELYLDFDRPLIIITGLTIYESINFFIFLFYNILMQKAPHFAIRIWDVHNISFIIFCLFIAYAFYGKQKSVASRMSHAL